MECNVSKNRYPNLLPSMSIFLPSIMHNYAIAIILIDDHFRVMLRAIAATGSDYINASFVDVHNSMHLLVVCSF
jgi:protein tyrosine phosphatase